MTKSLQGQPSIFDQSFVSNKSLKYVQNTQGEIDNIKHEGHGSGRKLHGCALPCHTAVIFLSYRLMHLGLWNYREASVTFQIIDIQKLNSATEKGGGRRGLPALLEKLIF